MSSPALDRRSLTAGGLVWSAALLLGLWRGVRPRAANGGVPVVWLLDRGAGQLVGLCRRLAPVVGLPLAARQTGGAGRLLVSAAPGEVWVTGEQRIQQVRGDGSVSVDLAALEVRDLAPLGKRDVVLLERGGALRRVHATGGDRRLVDVPGAQRIAGRGDRVLAISRAHSEAWLALVDAGTRPGIVALRRLERRPLDVAVAADGGWWLLEERRLTLLTREGNSVWSRSVPRGATWLAPCAGGVWLEDPERCGLLCIGLFAEQTAWMEVRPALRRPRAAVALGDGLLLATPGALVVLAPDGRVVGSQGGFDDLVAVALAVR